MRILIATHHLNTGGVETHASTLAHSLIRMGHTVVFASGGGLLANGLVAAGARVYHFDLAPRAPQQIESAARGIADLIVDERIEVVHIHHFLPLVTVALGAAKVNRPWLFTAHGVQPATEWMWYFGPWHYRVCRAMIQHAAGLIAVSEEVADHLAKVYIVDRSRIQVVHNPIDADRFSFSGPRRLRDSGTRLRLLYASRLDHDKRAGIRSAFDLLECLLQTGCDAELTIIGGGSIVPEVTELAERVNAEQGGRVQHVGPRIDLETVLADADVVLGVGRVILEGLATGKIAIISGSNGLIDVVTPDNFSALNRSNFSGRGFASASAEALARKLATVMELGPAALDPLEELSRRVRESYGAPHISNRTLALYGEAMGRTTREDCEAVRVAMSKALRGDAPADEPPPTDVWLTADAQTLMAAGERAAAIDALRSVLQVAPGDAHALVAIGHLLRESGMSEEAFSVLNSAAALHPENVEIRLEEALAALALGQHEIARRTLKQAITFAPENPNLAGALILCDVVERDAIIRDLRGLCPG